MTEPTTSDLRPVSSLNPQAATVSDLSNLLVPWFARLREAGTIEADEIPDDELVAELTVGLFTDRQGPLRKRANPAKGASGAVRGAHGLFRWHQSGGNLEGLFFARWAAGELYPAVETYISVLRLASGRTSSPAIDAWARTGLTQV